MESRLKIRRLHEIDLARIALLPADEKRTRLRRHRSGRAPYSYDPARAVLLDVVNAQALLPFPAPATPWNQIEARLRRESTTDEGFIANKEVTELLFGFVQRDGFSASQIDIGRMPVGVGETVAYWINAVLTRGDEIILPFFDHRRAKGLTALGRKFVFSMMREHLAARQPDLDARLAIFQFPQEGDDRAIRFLLNDPSADQLTYEQLDAAVMETYAIWREVLEERLDEARKTGTGGGFWE
jgi:hypothetical protein